MPFIAPATSRAPDRNAIVVDGVGEGSRRSIGEGRNVNAAQSSNRRATVGARHGVVRNVIVSRVPNENSVDRPGDVRIAGEGAGRAVIGDAITGRHGSAANVHPIIVVRRRRRTNDDDPEIHIADVLP